MNLNVFKVNLPHNIDPVGLILKIIIIILMRPNKRLNNKINFYHD